MSDVIEAPRAAIAPVTGEEAAAWRAQREATAHALREEGMLPEVAGHGAHWALLLDLRAAKRAPTMYDAEALLAEVHIMPPQPVGHPGRWSYLRPEDTGSPGARSLDAPTPEPEGPPPGWSPAERAQMTLARKLPMLDLWAACHGRATVRIEDVDQRVREALAGSKLDQWSDHDFAAWFGAVGQVQLGKGLVFQAVRQGEEVVGFKADYRPRNRWPDPKDDAWKARNAAIRARADELRDDPTFWPSISYEDRLNEADAQAFREAVATLAADEGVLPNVARERLRAAGIR